MSSGEVSQGLLKLFEICVWIHEPPSQPHSPASLFGTTISGVIGCSSFIIAGQLNVSYPTAQGVARQLSIGYPSRGD
jgi:hypothetical protein|nr:hypothetical protein pJBCL41_00307 [Pseudomonas sp.]